VFVVAEIKLPNVMFLEPQGNAGNVPEAECSDVRMISWDYAGIVLSFVGEKATTADEK
jgi:hypothetical protein